MKSKNLKPVYSNRNRSPKIRKGSTLLIDEMFLSIQTEGPFSGLPAYFIRLWGCNLNCSFCDTPQKKKPHKFKVKDILKMLDEKCHLPTIIITGGEPFLQDLSELTATLLDAGFMIQFETAGVLPAKGIPLDHPKVNVVVSPKTKKIDSEIAKHALAFKYVVSNSNIDHKNGLPKGVFIPKDKLGRIMVSPMWDGTKTDPNIQLAVSVCTTFGYWLTIQTHKFIGIQ